MALTPKFSDEAVNDAVDAVAALLDDGYLRIYDGTQPANAATAITTQNLLAELRFNATAFGAGSAGVATAGAFTAEDSAIAGGTASWCRALKDDGSTVVMDGSVGTSGCNLNLNSVTIVETAPVEITSFTLTVSKG